MHLDAQPLGEGLRRGGDRLRAARRFRHVPRRHGRAGARLRDGAATGDHDPRQPIKEIIAGGDAAIDLGDEAVGAAQPRRPSRPRIRRR